MPEVIYRIELVRWIGPDNTPNAYWEVYCGHSPRDYAAVDYTPLAPMNPRVTFGTRDEALNYVKEKNNGN